MTQKLDDRFFYMYNAEAKEYEFGLFVKDMHDSDHFQVQLITTSPATFGGNAVLGFNPLKWASVGVYKVESIDETVTLLPKDCVWGKAILVSNGSFDFIMTVPHPVIKESQW